MFQDANEGVMKMCSAIPQVLTAGVSTKTARNYQIRDQKTQ